MEFSQIFNIEMSKVQIQSANAKKAEGKGNLEEKSNET